MKSLATLIKLQKSHVDEQRQHVARLQEQLDTIRMQMTDLEAEKAREQMAAEQNADLRPTYAAFLKGAILRGKKLEKEREAAEIAINIARDKLTELFEEQKRYEVAEEARIAAEAADERRRERLDLDEIGTVGFMRKRDD